MLGDPTMLVLDSMDMIFSPPSINPAVEEFSIGVTFFEVGDSRTLFLA